MDDDAFHAWVVLEVDDEATTGSLVDGGKGIEGRSQMTFSQMTRAELERAVGR